MLAHIGCVQARALYTESLVDGDGIRSLTGDSSEVKKSLVSLEDFLSRLFTDFTDLNAPLPSDVRTGSHAMWKTRVSNLDKEMSKSLTAMDLARKRNARAEQEKWSE